MHVGHIFKISKMYVESSLVSNDGASSFHLIPSIDPDEKLLTLKSKQWQVCWSRKSRLKTDLPVNVLFFSLHSSPNLRNCEPRVNNKNYSLSCKLESSG